MEESRDTTIKLFGKTILLQVEGESPFPFGKNGSGDKQKVVDCFISLPPLRHEASPRSKNKKEGTPTPAEQGDESEKNEPNICTSPDKSSNSEEQLSEVTADHSATQEKLLKKPDKVLPCPRCSSMETKFCYYNNYSVNQPRHFCKNCQRYWTAGGTMRNLPVGAGRRKNKCSSYSSNTNQNFSHITISDELHLSLEHNRTVLSFGSHETPLCTSMGSVFNTVEKTMKKYNRNGFHQVENGEEQPSSSLLDTECGEANAGNSNCSERFAVQVPYFNGTVPWTYPWSPPIPFYPTMTYWGMPWLSPPPLSSNFSCPGLNSPTLGKHSREGNILKHDNSNKRDSPKQENCIWMPKTLRVDDPEEAAKSSIWSSTGFRNDKGDNVISGGGLFMDFHSKGELKDHSTSASLQILYANPAAHLRSFNFHEST